MFHHSYTVTSVISQFTVDCCEFLRQLVNRLSLILLQCLIVTNGSQFRNHPQYDNWEHCHSFTRKDDPGTPKTSPAFAPTDRTSAPRGDHKSSPRQWQRLLQRSHRAFCGGFHGDLLGLWNIWHNIEYTNIEIHINIYIDNQLGMIKNGSVFSNGGYPENRHWMLGKWWLSNGWNEVAYFQTNPNPFIIRNWMKLTLSMLWWIRWKWCFFTSVNGLYTGYTKNE